VTKERYSSKLTADAVCRHSALEDITLRHILLHWKVASSLPYVPISPHHSSSDFLLFETRRDAAVRMPCEPEDQPSKEGGVMVLSNVMENENSYTDLQENPSLCSLCRVLASGASTEGQEVRGGRVDEQGSQIARRVYLW
jgi:hypothetical protein